MVSSENGYHSNSIRQQYAYLFNYQKTISKTPLYSHGLKMELCDVKLDNEPHSVSSNVWYYN